MKNLKNYSKKFIYILFLVIVILNVKGKTDSIEIDILAYLILALLSLWYLYKNDTVKYEISNHIALQIFHGIWTAIMLVILILGILSFFFRISVDISLNNEIQVLCSVFVVFQLIVAIVEELVFRECLYIILLSEHIPKIISIIVISISFGFMHFYLYESIIQFICTSIFSFVVFILRHKLKNYMLISSISTHFVYNIILHFFNFY